MVERVNMYLKYVSGNTDLEMSTSRLHLSLPGNVDIDADEKREKSA
jgi:hypothetical protein